MADQMYAPNGKRIVAVRGAVDATRSIEGFSSDGQPKYKLEGPCIPHPPLFAGGSAYVCEEGKTWPADRCSKTPTFWVDVKIKVVGYYDASTAREQLAGILDDDSYEWEFINNG
jgi:hypothetical protein